MYYESRSNSISDISDKTIDEQIQALKTIGIGKGYIIGNSLWINDANPSGCGGKEAAVLLIRNNSYFSFESITIPWCKDDEIKDFITEFQNVEETIKAYSIDLTKATVLNNTDALVFFDCGCCGSGFKSTIKEQVQFDQDSGFGICPSCAERWS